MRPPVLRQSGRGDIARGTIISGETQLVNPSPEQRAERRTNVINYGRKGGGKTRTEPSQSRGLPTVTPVDRRQAWPGGGQSQPPGFMGFSRRTTTYAEISTCPRPALAARAFSLVPFIGDIPLRLSSTGD